MVLSAGGHHSGVQGIMIETRAGSSYWQVLSNAFFPYDGNQTGLFSRVFGSDSSASGLDIADVTAADYYLSRLHVQCARGLIDNAPGLTRSPDIILLNKVPLWEEPVKEGSSWTYALGQPWLVGRETGVAVLSGPSPATRHKSIPIDPGVRILGANAASKTVLFINLGLMARIIVYDATQNRIVMDTRPSPGTCLVNAAARSQNIGDGMDRDGEAAHQGEVDTACILQLHKRLQTVMKKYGQHLSPQHVTDLLTTKCVDKLMGNDKVATLTAFTAFSLFKYFKQHVYRPSLDASVWISGGGAKNRTLHSFLQAYFGAIPVHSVEEWEVPVESFIPCCEGLSFNSLLQRMSFVSRHEKLQAYFNELVTSPW